MEQGSARRLRGRGSGNAPPLRAGKQVAAEPRPLPAAVRPRPDSRPAGKHIQHLRGALLLPGPPRLSRSPSGGRVKGAFSKVKARPAPGDFPQPSTSFAIALLKIVVEAGNPNSPHRSARRRIYFTARNTLRQTRDFRERECGVSGRWNVAKAKHTPPRHTTTSRLRGVRVRGHCAPDFIQRSSLLRQV